MNQKKVQMISLQVRTKSAVLIVENKIKYF